MRPYHAYPGLTPGDPDGSTVNDTDITDDGLVDPPFFPYASRGVLAVFYGKHRYPYKYYFGTGQQNSSQKYKAIRDLDALADDAVTWWSDVIYDPQSDPTGMVPTADSCSDGISGDKTTCEANGYCTDTQYLNETDCTTNGATWRPQWWRPGHRLGEPEYFSIPTFDIPLNNSVDEIIIGTRNGETDWDPGTATITVYAETQTASTAGDTNTNKIYAIWAGVKKKMTLDSSSGGTDAWRITFTSADGVSDTADTAPGRIYVISVDESGDNHDLLWQAHHDEHVK
jgi:hypothetical protein